MCDNFLFILYMARDFQELVFGIPEKNRVTVSSHLGGGKKRKQKRGKGKYSSPRRASHRRTRRASPRTRKSNNRLKYNRLKYNRFSQKSNNQRIMETEYL